MRVSQGLEEGLHDAVEVLPHEDVFQHVQRASASQFHHDVGLAALDRDVVHAHDARMVEARGRARLALEARPLLARIAAPGRASLEAALAPADGDWLYYVRTDEGDVPGAHTFAITSREFERARRVCIEKDLGCG